MPRPDRRLAGGEYDSPPDLAIIKFRGSDSPATRIPGRARPGSLGRPGCTAGPGPALWAGSPGVVLTAWLRISSYSSVGAAGYGSPCQPGCCQCPYYCQSEPSSPRWRAAMGAECGGRGPGTGSASGFARDLVAKFCHFLLIWKVPHRPPLLLVDIKESIYIL